MKKQTTLLYLLFLLFTYSCSQKNLIPMDSAIRVDIPQGNLNDDYIEYFVKSRKNAQPEIQSLGNKSEYIWKNDTGEITKYYLFDKDNSCYYLYSKETISTVLERYYVEHDNDVIESVTIPDGRIEILKKEFLKLPVKKVVLSNTVEIIGEDAFLGCDSLEDISLSESLREIGKDAFMGCTSLLSIQIPNSVTKIGDGAFEGCSSLNNVILSESLTDIRNSVFAECSSLTSIQIPNSVKVIGKSAFSKCRSLTDVILPKSLEKIEYFAFKGCDSMMNLSVADSLQRFKKDDISRLAIGQQLTLTRNPVVEKAPLSTVSVKDLLGTWMWITKEKETNYGEFPITYEFRDVVVFYANGTGIGYFYTALIEGIRRDAIRTPSVRFTWKLDGNKVLLSNEEMYDSYEYVLLSGYKLAKAGEPTRVYKHYSILQ